MNKLLFAFILGFCSLNLSAAIVTVENIKITEISAYDDYQNGIVRVEMSNTHPACTSGSYLKPDSIGFDALYSLLLSSATARLTAKFQLYDDRVIDGLCEIDAIRIKF